jgi:hypothetical protein
MLEPEIAIIPWHGRDRLTMTKALVFIHLLALLSHDIRSGYLPLTDDPDYEALRESRNHGSSSSSSSL